MPTKVPMTQTPDTGHSLQIMIPRMSVTRPPRAANQPEWRLSSRLAAGSRPTDMTAACSMAQLLPRPTDGVGDLRCRTRAGLRARSRAVPLGRAASRPPGAHASSWARPVRRRVTQRGAGASCSQAASPLLWACGPGSLAARRPRSRARPHERQELRNELKNIEVTVSSDYSPDLAEALARG